MAYESSISLDPLNGSTPSGVIIDGAVYSLQGEPPLATPVLGPIDKVAP